MRGGGGICSRLSAIGGRNSKPSHDRRPVIPAVRKSRQNAKLLQRAPRQRMRLLDEPDDLALRGGRVSVARRPGRAGHSPSATGVARRSDGRSVGGADRSRVRRDRISAGLAPGTAPSARFDKPARCRRASIRRRISRPARKKARRDAGLSISICERLTSVRRPQQQQPCSRPASRPGPADRQRGSTRCRPDSDSCSDFDWS